MESAYKILFTVVLCVLGCGIFISFFRTVRGPSPADRIVGINMISTITIAIIAVVSVMMGEGYLMDITLIYTLLSFLAVVILSKVYIGIYRAKHAEENKE